jgi:hydroxymethylpyrimidine/phosphomethylpyrimidine kinase
MQGRVLIIAGSDSGGGAGIQADIKTVTALGGYASTAITALTVQNSLGVQSIQLVEPEFVSDQMMAVLDDIGADMIKVGMLGDGAMIAHVARTIQDLADGPRVLVDPVMVAKGGASLMHDDALSVMIHRLIPLAWLVTPNIPEAQSLTGITIAGADDMAMAGAKIRAMGAQNVLVKGGHLEGDDLVDMLVTEDGFTSYESSRIDTKHTHGTGCTLASAIATLAAQGRELPTAIAGARGYVQEAIRTAPGYGSGHGPLNHGHPFQTTK